jgi:hypothetical protein
MAFELAADPVKWRRLRQRWLNRFHIKVQLLFDVRTESQTHAALHDTIKTMSRIHYTARSRNGSEIGVFLLHS